MTSDAPVRDRAYRHYKGGHYIVERVYRHSETREDMVVYYNLEHESGWVRPLSEWMKEVDGQPSVIRFEEVCRKCWLNCNGECYT